MAYSREHKNWLSREWRKKNRERFRRWKRQYFAERYGVDEKFTLAHRQASLKSYRKNYPQWKLNRVLREMLLKCYFCGRFAVEVDESRGVLYCGQC